MDRTDKLLHFTISALIYITIFKLTNSMGWGIALTLLVGIGKELYDSTGKGNAEYGDFIANVAGIVVGIIIM